MWHSPTTLAPLSTLALESICVFLMRIFGPRTESAIVESYSPCGCGTPFSSYTHKGSMAHCLRLFSSTRTGSLEKWIMWTYLNCSSEVPTKIHITVEIAAYYPTGHFKQRGTRLLRPEIDLSYDPFQAHSKVRTTA